MNQTQMNCSGRNHTSQMKTWKFILQLNFDVIITVAALLSSYLVLRAFHKFQNLRTASNIILVSFSIADGLLALSRILDIIHLSIRYNATEVKYLLRVPVLKEVSRTFTFFLVSVIILHLALMSVERFIAIKFALTYHTIVTKRRSRIVSIAMWLWALVVTIALPKVLKLMGKDFRNADSNTSQVLHTRWHLVFQAASMFLVPLLIILCSYTYIFIVSYKQRQHVREQGRDVPGMPTIKHQMKGARTLAIVVALCLLSIIPMPAVTFLRVFRGILIGGRYHQKLLKQILYDVAMFVNAICNPLIYGWKNEEFRNAFRKMLKCCLVRKRF